MTTPIELSALVAFCDTLTRRSDYKDFTGSHNGLQVANTGKVRKIAAAVDAGRAVFEEAAKRGADFVIVHHGLYWETTVPVVGKHHAKLRQLIQSDTAVYASHLPLDAHPEIGNNALMAKALGLSPGEGFLPYEGKNIGLLCPFAGNRAELRQRLAKEFPKGFQAIEFGSETPRVIGVLTGSGASAINALKAAGVDTLITGELRQQHFNQAQEEGLNLYLCGHYATETYGVKALAERCAKEFGLPWEFIDTGCPL